MSKYETKGGQLSEGDMIAKLTDLTKECADLAYMISHYNNSHHRTDRGEGFRRFGENYEKVAKFLTGFASAGGRTQ